MQLLNGEKPPAPSTAPDGTPYIPQTPTVVTAENMKIVFDDGNAKISDVCTKEVTDACQKAGLS
jgi:D-xylose transport system substrate-binding protein